VNRNPVRDRDDDAPDGESVAGDAAEGTTGWPPVVVARHSDRRPFRHFVRREAAECASRIVAEMPRDARRADE